MKETIKIPADFRDPSQVKEFIRSCLADNSARIAHVLEIARRVRSSGELLGLKPFELDLAECAALLHDIGYWKPIALTGFHPIDGARFLEQQQESELAKLIVGHSCSPEEGELSGFPGIKQDDSLVAKLITYWDVQVKQGGYVVSYEERLAEIINRYGDTSIIGIANIRAKARIEKIIKEIGASLAAVA